VSGTPSGNVYVIVEDADGAFSSAFVAVNAGVATVTLNVNPALAPGRYTRPLVLRACKDAGCTQPYAGSPQTVAKDIRVQSLQLGTARLAFSASIGVGAPAQAVAVSAPQGEPLTYDDISYVDYTSPAGATSLFRPSDVFEVTRTATGFSVRAKGSYEGTFRWTLRIGAPGYRSQAVDVSYVVAGNGVPAYALLGSTLEARAVAGTAEPVYADLDVLVNMPVSEVRIDFIAAPGTADPVQTGWVLYYDSLAFTQPPGPADNARHLRFVFRRCGYGIPDQCLPPGLAQATLRLTVRAFNGEWVHDVPVRFTVE